MDVELALLGVVVHRVNDTTRVTGGLGEARAS